MGLTAVCDEGEIIVRYNGKILQRYFLENWSEVKEAELLSSGADYVEFHVHRLSHGVSSDTPEHPPHCLVDQYALSHMTDRLNFEATGERPLVDDRMKFLISKEFNIETHVDPRFIHGLFFAWTGFLNTTFAQLRAPLTKAQRYLRQQEEYHLLETRCKDLKAANFPITNIVVLGNGSLNTPDSKRRHDYVEPRYEGLLLDSYAQLAAIMEISMLLGGTSRRPGLRKSRDERKQVASPLRLTNLKLGTVKPLPCVFQDPATSRFEQRFLRSLGHKVVDDPDAFDLINANSLVIFIHNPGMEDHIMKGVWPAAILAWKSGPRLIPEATEPEFAHALEEEDAKLEQFEEAYNVQPFMENRKLSQDGLTCLWTNTYNFYVKKDLDGAADFSFTV